MSPVEGGAKKRLTEAERTDPRCKKGHRPRVDFKGIRLGWFCETCHADLEFSKDNSRFVLTDNPEPKGDRG